MDFMGNMFENERTKDDISEIVNKISNYDIFDFIARISGLNLMSENQNKSVLLDTLIQYVLAKEESDYVSKSKISAGKFKSIINELNSTNLSLSIDPCENVFIQNVMMGSNYRVFNGIDLTPAHNLQALIRVLFQYQNTFHEEYLRKVYRLFSLILGISEEIVRSLNIDLHNVKYDEQRMVILPSSEAINCFAEKIVYPLDKVKGYIAEYFEIEEIVIGFGVNDTGDLDNRPFYQKPFLINPKDNTIIILNVSLLPAFAFYKAIEWAEEYNLKKDVINRYNDYLWLESKRTLDKLGHKKIKERTLGLECISLDYYKEMIATIYNNQLMIVIFLCDDGFQYPEKGIHVYYSDERHNNIFQERINYFGEKIKESGTPNEDWYVLIITNSFGRIIGFGVEHMPFCYKPIRLNPFELHCISIKERNVANFFPRYIRAKSQINTMMSDVFSELNSVCIYTSNNYTFYMSDDVSMDEMNIYIAPGDSVEYISEALKEENRILIDSYIDGEKAEVIYTDKLRSIYVEDDLFLEKQVAYCVAFDNVKIWITTDEIQSFEEINIYFSLVDAISYWLAECKQIIELFDLFYYVYVFNISLTGKPKEYYYERNMVVPYSECIGTEINKNHIFLKWTPEAFGNLNQTTNIQEKDLCIFLFEILNDLSYEHCNYKVVLDGIFSDPLKKKFFSFAYENKPYLKPVELGNNRKIREEDEDYLAGTIGRELLQSGNWEIGIVPEEKRNEVSHAVVDWLYNRLQTKVAELSTDNIIEMIYFDLEKTLYKLILSERRFYMDIACYPEKEKMYLEEYNNLNRTSLALKFLIEYITAQPATGNKQLGVGQYEELLAICSMIIEWAYKGDLLTYGIISTPIEFLRSKRIGLKKDEFIDMYQYSDVYRRRQLKFDSSYVTRKHYSVNFKDYADELEMAYFKEFGYKYSDFVKVIATMVVLNEKEIMCIEESCITSMLIELNETLSEDVIKNVLNDITYRPRADYLKLPSKYNAWEAYPWRFNRRYSFNRRPVLQRDNSLIWGNRQLYHMLEYVTDLIHSGKFTSESQEMVELIGKISKSRGAAFNELIVDIIQDMNEFTIFPNVKKINGKKISNLQGNTLGDIDILIIDKVTDKIIAAEVKDFHFSRNPYEIQQEYLKMFVDKDKMKCFATKHTRRVEWLKEHIQDVKIQYGLDNREWDIKGIFIVSKPLISNAIYKQNIKCISRAELCAEIIRNI